METCIDRIATTWSDRDDVYTYFNNDPGGAAVGDAALFGRTAQRADLTVTRTPRALASRR